MNQLMLAAVSRIIIGPTGRRIAAYGDICAAYTQGLYADYYKYNPHVTDKTFYKYANRTSPYPHFLSRHYGGAGGYRRILGDMLGIADACSSIILLWQIQAEVYRWVTTHLPPDTAHALAKDYVNQGASRREVAMYLADILHYAITVTPT